jgi:4-aminobutyrate aminotransferase-like enzyme
LGAVIGEKELMSQAAKSIHALESGAANPICCAASLESIRLIRKNNLEKRAADMGEEVMRRLQDLAGDVEEIGEVRGLGLMIGVELVKDRRSKQPDSEHATQVVREAAKRGVLMDRVGICKNVLRISPPLNIPAEDMTRSIDIIEEILAKL